MFDTDEGLSGTPSIHPTSTNTEQEIWATGLLPFICKQTDNPLEPRVDLDQLSIVPNPLFKLEWSVLSRDGRPQSGSGLLYLDR